MHHMTKAVAAGPHQYRAVVFQRAPSTPDFSCSLETLLPGEHTAEGAWSAVLCAMRNADYIGGEIRACAPLAGQ
jgi:hypothetical protein